MSEQNVCLTFDLFQSFMHGRAPALAMSTEFCHLSRLEPDWKMTSMGLERQDRGSFRVRGVRVVHASGQEVAGWTQPMFTNEKAEYIALIVRKVLEQELVLVCLMAEPGNAGIRDGLNQNTRVLVAPSVQFSQVNFWQHEKFKRGALDENGKPLKPVPFAEAVLGKHHNVDWQSASEDGGRFFQKLNHYGLIRVAGTKEIQADLEATGMMENYSWISLPVLRNLCRLGLVSGHLRSCMSLLV